MNNTQKLIALMTPRDWQIQANKETAELVGSPEYYAKAAEAKRYGMLADALEAAQAEIERLTARANVENVKATSAVLSRDAALARLGQDRSEWKEATHAALRLGESYMAEKNAALARLAELSKQEPVAYFDVCVNGDVGAVRFIPHQGEPLKSGDKLFAAAGASPQPSQAVELSALLKELDKKAGSGFIPWEIEDAFAAYQAAINAKGSAS